MKDLRIHVIPAKAGNQQYKFDLKASGSLIKSGMTRGVSLCYRLFTLKSMTVTTTVTITIFHTSP
ncbi:hypothetical protein [Candidatus Uabimicrobium amorphum]|nr:hypothetical protein [Candidatus Uabimicrobium amorphum]